VLEQKFVALRVELARHVIEQEDRRVAMRAGQDGELGGLPRQHDRAQLALAPGEVIMQARTILSAVVLAMLGAAVEVEPAESTAESDIVVQCSNKSWLVNFYAEAAHINLVGTLRCVCFRPQTSTGISSNFPVLVSERTCSVE
jgi:hypothetical protein